MSATFQQHYVGLPWKNIDPKLPKIGNATLCTVCQGSIFGSKTTNSWKAGKIFNFYLVVKNSKLFEFWHPKLVKNCHFIVSI